MDEKNIYITPFENLKPVAMTIIAYLQNVILDLEKIHEILKDNQEFKIRYKQKFSFSSNIINISYRNNIQNINIKISNDNIHYTGLKSLEDAYMLSLKIMKMIGYEKEEYSLNIKKVMINYNFHIGFCINKIEFVKYMNENPFQISFDNTFNQHIKVYHYYTNSEGKRVRETLIVRWKGSVTISSSNEEQMKNSYYLFLDRVNRYYNEISILNQVIYVSNDNNIENEILDDEFINQKIMKLKNLIKNKEEQSEEKTKIKNIKYKNNKFKINID